MLDESDVLTLGDGCNGMSWREQRRVRNKDCVQLTVDDFRERMQAKADFERDEALALVKKLVELEGGLTYHLMCKTNRILCTYSYRCEQIYWLGR